VSDERRRRVREMLEHILANLDAVPDRAIDAGWWQWWALGLHYGYPECCIEAFCADEYEVSDRPLHPTGGWVMCEECAEEHGA
jgi:hypothetical protein